MGLGVLWLVGGCFRGWGTVMDVRDRWGIAVGGCYRGRCDAVSVSWVLIHRLAGGWCDRGVDQEARDSGSAGGGNGSAAALAVSVRALRGSAVRRLLALRREGKLTTRHVRVAADALGVRERAVWRWLAAAEQDEAAAAAPGERARYHGRFTVTAEVRALLGLWKGNVAAVHRELTARAARGEGGLPPSIATLHRAIRRDLTPGERAGLAGGEREARKYDVFLSRPRGWRNQVWEADHVQAPVLVDDASSPNSRHSATTSPSRSTSRLTWANAGARR